MDEDDLDRICAEFHATNDPYGSLRAEARALAQRYIAAFSDPTAYDRTGRARAIAEWRAAMPELVEPAKPPVRSFAGKHLSWDAVGALEVCRTVAREHPTRTRTWVAREAAKILFAQFVSRPQHEIVEIAWRAAEMPVSAETGAPFADPATGLIITRCSPGQVTQLRQDIEKRCGPISYWSKTVVQERDPATFDRDPAKVDEALFRQLKRLVESNGVGQPDY
jgi:hypothetical protein